MPETQFFILELYVFGLIFNYDLKNLSTLCHAHICACVDSSTAQVENFLNTGPQFHRKFALGSFLLLLL